LAGDGHPYQASRPTGGPLDKVCHNIFEQHGGEFVGCGTFLLTGERDIEFKIPDKEVPSRCTDAPSG
jgi:hypothetical protein